MPKLKKKEICREFSSEIQQWSFSVKGTKVVFLLMIQTKSELYIKQINLISWISKVQRIESKIVLKHIGDVIARKQFN